MSVSCWFDYINSSIILYLEIKIFEIKILIFSTIKYITFSIWSLYSQNLLDDHCWIVHWIHLFLSLWISFWILVPQTITCPFLGKFFFQKLFATCLFPKREWLPKVTQQTWCLRQDYKLQFLTWWLNHYDSPQFMTVT